MIFMLNRPKDFRLTDQFIVKSVLIKGWFKSFMLNEPKIVKRWMPYTKSVLLYNENLNHWSAEWQFETFFW